MRRSAVSSDSEKSYSLGTTGFRHSILSIRFSQNPDNILTRVSRRTARPGPARCLTTRCSWPGWRAESWTLPCLPSCR